MATVLERPATAKPVEKVTHQTPRIRLLTVAEYDKMIEAGIFNANDRVELLEGVLIELSPKGPRHAYSTDCATKLLIERVGDRAVVRNQNPVTIDAYSEPEPDIVLAMPSAARYAHRHPGSDEVFAVLEIADTTLAFDRSRKGLAYAKAGIRQFIIVNVDAREVEDYRDPAPDGYRNKQTLTSEQEFFLAAFPDVSFKVGDFLPPLEENEG